MDDQALAEAVEHHTIFAKFSPLNKERIVRSLRSNGHVVGFMGDGINDAPALRAADIGISVNTAVDIAKDAADIIRLERSLPAAGHDVVHHSGGHFSAHGALGQLFQAGSAAAGLFWLAGGDIAGLCGADDADETR
ncbi:P-type E1-E2 ATPase [Polaromonas sp. CG_9.11]|nr:P-type E1-E2 ATPase [Polaromonas sp. CG_9.11]